MRAGKKPPRDRARPPSPSESGRAREGDVFEVSVERILPGGMGMAHRDGQTVFVALAAPGDRAIVRVERARGNVAFASIRELLAPSPARVEPPCPYFGSCGGCDFQQLSYEAQLEAKVSIIRDCLRRIARVEPPADIPVTPSPLRWRYRSRARWQHDPVRKHLGYHERGTHHVIDVRDCPVAAPPVQQKLDELRARMNEGSLPEEAAEFEAVAGDGGGVSLTPPLEEEDAAEQARVIDGERYRFGAGCFFQINHALLPELVRAGLGDARGASALDLYCGVGLFTLPLARRFARVLGVEGNPPSADYARSNLSAAGLTNARVETSHVGDFLSRHAADTDAHDAPRPPYDFLLLDPPRAGADPQTIDAIRRLAPPRIAYVSCDPATLARDLRALTADGYAITSIQALDMFPQTHHVETVVHLNRSLPHN